jgi:hypothetical protein
MINDSEHRMKNYRFFGDEMEILGRRLDNAREALDRSKSSKNAWGINHWSQVVDRLLFQWRQLPMLHDGEASNSVIPRWTIDYNFYELGRFHESYGLTDKFYDKLFKHNAELDHSWHTNREQRLAKAQY